MRIIEKLLNLPLPVLNHWGYWIILLVTVLEASPVFGLFIPGQSFIILGGFLAKMGILRIGDVIFVSACGAILGDFIGYELGRRYGPSLIKRYGKYVLFKKEHYEKTQDLMHKHAGKTLVIGRLHPITRSFAPFVAGSMNISFSRFIVFNVISGLCWALSFVSIGYLFGTSYEIASKYIGKFIFLAMTLSIIMAYAYYFINKRKHLFARYHLYTLALNIFSLYLFSKMIEDVVGNELITKIDSLVSTKIIALWHPLLNKIMIFISEIGSVSFLMVLSVILFIVLAYKKKWYHSLLLSSALTVALLTEFLIKSVLFRARPVNALITPTGYSFPSAHTVTATIFFALFLYSFKDGIKKRYIKHIFALANIVVFLLLSFSFIYLNVHWLSDVIAGFALGLFWLTFLILIFKYASSLLKKNKPLPQLS